MIFHNVFLAKAMPEFTIDQAEAETLSAAILNYLRHYDSMKVDPKTRDFYALLMVVVTIEGLRAYRVMMRRQAQTQAAKTEARMKAEAAGQIVNMGR